VAYPDVVILEAVMTARFVRSENVKHYQNLLARASDAIERKKIQTLLDEEEKKQSDAGDFDHLKQAG
jgi:hypothetical protein